MKYIKLFENFITEGYDFDFENWTDTDLNGAGAEIEMDELIGEWKEIINKTIDNEFKKTPSPGVDPLSTKRAAARAIRQLWIEKINKDLRF